MCQFGYKAPQLDDKNSEEEGQIRTTLVIQSPEESFYKKDETLKAEVYVPESLNGMYLKHLIRYIRLGNMEFYVTNH